MVDAAPAAIVAVKGTETLLLFALSEKLKLLVAGPDRLMVHVLLPGVWTVVGEQVKFALELPCRLTVMLLLLPPHAAVSVGV